jgi:hypothetical protein
MKGKELINDDRLTPTMERIRNGESQMFRDTKQDDRSFIGRENADVILTHPTDVAMYAELIDNEWYWVTGCSECKGEERGWVTYIECDRHNICSSCSIPSKNLEEGVKRWGGKKGWTCGTCKDIKDLEIRETAFEKFNEEEHSEWDFTSNDEIICPHCGTELSSDEVYESQDMECYVCEGEIEVDVEFALTYSTSVKGKRVLK